MDNNEIELVRSSMRNALDSNDPQKVIGSLLAEGWLELAETDPGVAVSVLAEEAGASLSAAPIVDLALIWGSGIDLDGSTAFVLPQLGSKDFFSAKKTGSGYSVDGLVLAGTDRAGSLLASTEEGVIKFATSAVTATAVKGNNPDMNIRIVRAEISLNDATIVADSAAWSNGLSVGRRALASQMVGASRQMLADTLEYIKVREQYGRSIGSFQSVKHRMADVHALTMSAVSTVATSWEESDDVLPVAAKVVAGRAQALTSQHCHQVHGGIAFTVEHGFQRWMRRGNLLNELLGSSEMLISQVGRKLLARGTVPRVPNLRD